MDTLSDLIPLFRFVHFCKSHSINTSVDELLQLQQKELFSPLDKSNGLYSRYQLYPLSIVKSFQGIDIERIRLFLHKRLAEEYSFIIFIIEVDKLYQKREEELDLSYQKSLSVIKEEITGKDFLPIRDKRSCENAVDSKYQQAISELLRDNNLTIEEIKNRRKSFVRYGSFGSRLRSQSSKLGYLNHIPEARLIQLEHPYKVIHRLNWITQVLTGIKQTVNDYLLENNKSCTECGTQFIPIRINQRTCGSSSCIKEHGNDLKRIRRKENRYH